MKGLSPDYLAELARQFLTVSAFLSGVATTFLARMLTVHSRRQRLHPLAALGGLLGGWTLIQGQGRLRGCGDKGPSAHVAGSFLFC
jgi:hypothetical protein